MTPAVTTGSLLSSALFELYSKDWLQTVADPMNPALAASFLNGEAGRVPGLSFSLQSIKGLVSAPGALRLKARFLLFPNASTSTPHFSLVLFAANAGDERISAYYLADQYWSTNPGSPQVGGEIPNSLASEWMNNWKITPAVTTALFATAHGPLEGYNFEVKDFVRLLFGVKPSEDQQVQLGFGLHEYYAPDANEETLTSTFGLVLQLGLAGRPIVPSQEAVFDLATPCPPNH